jgi:hypothetical protein
MPAAIDGKLTPRERAILAAYRAPHAADLRRRIPTPKVKPDTI